MATLVLSVVHVAGKYLDSQKASLPKAWSNDFLNYKGDIVPSTRPKPATLDLLHCQPVLHACLSMGCCLLDPDSCSRASGPAHVEIQILRENAMVHRAERQD